MRLGHTFFSLFLVLLISFIAVTWLLDEYWRTHSLQNADTYTGHLLVLDVIEGRLNEVPSEQWSSILSDLDEQYNFDIGVISSSQASAFSANRKVFTIGEVKIFIGDEFFDILQPMAGHSTYLKASSLALPARPKLQGKLRVIAFVVITLALFVWVWPMSRDLSRLESAAKEFGQGDFKAEADTAFSPLIAPLVKTFNMMAFRINRLIEAHKELTNAVSHELRTPVARTKFALEMIRNAKTEEQREKYLNKIAFDVAEQEELINELLLYASFEDDRPRLTWSEIDLYELAKTQKQYFNQFPANILLHEPKSKVSLQGDRHFLERALSNLLSNAVKYGDGEVVISVNCHGKNGQITVEDNGSGVNDEFKEVIFDAFSRGDESRTKDTGGFGLGLAIVGRIMQWHGGQVTVGDSDLGGAKFTLSWPMK